MYNKNICRFCKDKKPHKKYLMIMDKRGVCNNSHKIHV